MPYEDERPGHGVRVVKVHEGTISTAGEFKQRVTLFDPVAQVNVDVEMVIDLKRLVRGMGARAISNKSGKSQDGFVLVRKCKK